MKKIIFAKNYESAKILEIDENKIKTIGDLKEYLLDENLITRKELNDGYLYESLYKIQFESDDTELPKSKSFNYYGQVDDYNVFTYRKKSYKAKYENGGYYANEISHKANQLYVDLQFLKNYMKKFEENFDKLMIEINAEELKKIEKPISQFPENFNLYGPDSEDEEFENDDFDDEDY